MTTIDRFALILLALQCFVLGMMIGGYIISTFGPKWLKNRIAEFYYQHIAHHSG
jgi:hypothetical protein